MISVCILTKNSSETLKKTLDSLLNFSEVLILDTGSTDNTVAIAKNYPNVQIFSEPFSGFGMLRNKIAKKAKNDWILAIDSDEILSTDLFKEISLLKLSENTVYEIPRINFYNGKKISGCGWGSDTVYRLYNKKIYQFSSDEVHESIKTKKTLRLKSPLYHTPYRSTEDFLKKMQHYTTLFAKQNVGKKQSSFLKAFLKAIFSFFRSFILKGGFFDGKEGFVISLYNSNTTFYKYLKLKEENEKTLL